MHFASTTRPAYEFLIITSIARFCLIHRWLLASALSAAKPKQNTSAHNVQHNTAQ